MDLVWPYCCHFTPYALSRFLLEVQIMYDILVVFNFMSILFVQILFWPYIRNSDKCLCLSVVDIININNIVSMALDFFSLVFAVEYMSFNMYSNFFLLKLYLGKFIFFVFSTLTRTVLFPARLFPARLNKIISCFYDFDNLYPVHPLQYCLTLIIEERYY